MTLDKREEQTGFYRLQEEGSRYFFSGQIADVLTLKWTLVDEGSFLLFSSRTGASFQTRTNSCIVGGFSLS